MGWYKRKNRYLSNTKLSEHEFRRALKHFCLDDTVERTVQETQLHRATIVRLFGLLRLYIFQLCERELQFSGEVEVDESYFGARRVRGKRGRGARGKIPVVGLLKRGGKVYTKVVENCSREQLLPIIQGKAINEDFKKDLGELLKLSVQQMKILRNIIKEGPWLENE